VVHIGPIMAFVVDFKQN